MPEPVTAAEVATLAAGGAVVTGRDVVTVTGPDAAAYLQGQVSQDVDALDVGEGAWTFVLSPQGKVDVWGRLSRPGETEFALDLDPGHGPAARDRLTRFLLRTDATVELTTWPMVAVRGRDDVTAPDGVLALDPAWPGRTGVDLLGPGAAVPEGLATASTAALERLRVEAGVPALGAELTERTIPAEAGVVDRSVSFTKGCYTGQELVARIDSRGGNVPRRLRRLEAAEGAALHPGDDVVVAGEAVGTVTSVAPAVGAPTVALAYVARSVTVPADGAVGGAAVAIEAVPTS